MNWVPDRKVLAGGLGGVVTWLLVLLLQKAGLTVPSDVQVQISGLVGLALAYLVPPAQQDIVKRINNDLVAIATADPSNPTTAIIATPEAATAALKVGAAPKT